MNFDLSVKQAVRVAEYLRLAARTLRSEPSGDEFTAAARHARAEDAEDIAATIERDAQLAVARLTRQKAVPAGGNGLTIGEERAPDWNHVELSVTVDGRPQLYEVVSAGYLAAANSSDPEVVRVIRAVATGEGEEGSIGGGAGPLTTIRKAAR